MQIEGQLLMWVLREKNGGAVNSSNAKKKKAENAKGSSAKAVKLHNINEPL